MVDNNIVLIPKKEDYFGKRWLRMLRYLGLPNYDTYGENICDYGQFWKGKINGFLQSMQIIRCKLMDSMGFRG